MRSLMKLTSTAAIIALAACHTSDFADPLEATVSFTAALNAAHVHSQFLQQYGKRGGIPVHLGRDSAVVHALEFCKEFVATRDLSVTDCEPRLARVDRMASTMREASSKPRPSKAAFILPSFVSTVQSCETPSPLLEYYYGQIEYAIANASSGSTLNSAVSATLDDASGSLSGFEYDCLETMGAVAVDSWYYWDDSSQSGVWEPYYDPDSTGEWPGWGYWIGCVLSGVDFIVLQDAAAAWTGAGAGGYSSGAAVVVGIACATT